MAHRLKVKFVPGTNKDGSPSKTNGTWIVTDRTRGKTVTVYEKAGKNTKSEREAAETAAAQYLEDVHRNHAVANPNDQHYFAKHSS